TGPGTLASSTRSAGIPLGALHELDQLLVGPPRPPQAHHLARCHRVASRARAPPRLQLELTASIHLPPSHPSSPVAVPLPISCSDNPLRRTLSEFRSSTSLLSSPPSILILFHPSPLSRSPTPPSSRWEGGVGERDKWRDTSTTRPTE